MQSSIERRRLLKAMNEGPVYAGLVLAKCATGLAVIVLLALIGAHESLDRGAAGNVAAASTPAAAQPVGAHRKQVFDERRSRLESGNQRNKRMFDVVDLPKDLPMELL